MSQSSENSVTLHALPLTSLLDGFFTIRGFLDAREELEVLPLLATLAVTSVTLSILCLYLHPTWKSGNPGMGGDPPEGWGGAKPPNIYDFSEFGIP